MADLMRDVQVQRYYPNVLANADEFKLIAKLENAEFKSVWQEACKWFLNTFVYDTDLQGIKRWEDMLKIIPPKEATLEDRRNTVLMRINTMLPYTIRRLRQILNAVYGEDFATVSTNKDYELWVSIDNRIILNADFTAGDYPSKPDYKNPARTQCGFILIRRRSYKQCEYYSAYYGTEFHHERAADEGDYSG